MLKGKKIKKWLERFILYFSEYFVKQIEKD